MKKSFILTMVIVLMFSSLVYADNFDEVAGELNGVLIGDFESGRILRYSGDLDEPMAIASITKLMTYLVAMDKVEEGKISLDDLVTVEIDFKNEYPGYNEWSKFYLWKGEKLTLKDLLESMLIPSANDSAIVIADYVGGSPDDFTKLMNDKAKELGLNSAKFLNSNGFPVGNEENVMSMRDIFTLSRHIINKYPEILEITNKEFVLRYDNKHYSTNPLLPIMEDVDGLKTGYTDGAGYCLVSTLMVDDEDKPFRVIGVTMGANSKLARRNLGKKLLEFGINTYDNQKLVSKDEVVDVIKFKYGKEVEVDAILENDFYGVIKEDSEIRKEVTLIDNYKAPMSKGEKIGTVSYYDEDDTLIGKRDIVLSRDVKKANIFVRFWRFIKGLFVVKSN